MGRWRKKKAEAEVEEQVVETPVVEQSEPKSKGRKARVQADPIAKRPAVSVEDMIAENKSATVSTDYQRYLRKLMKQAGGKA